MAAGVRQLSWSAAEVSALGTKAARGAGAPPAQAARFGQVVSLHLMTGRDATDLSAALDALPAGPILDHPLTLDRAMIAAEKGEAAELVDVPFDALLQSYVEALPFAAEVVRAGPDRLIFRCDLAAPRVPPVLKRICGCDALITQMECLAACTLVPESDLSRLSGAGAGLTDND